MSQVRIGKTVDYEALETALVKAAGEMGWRARVRDEFSQSYRLGSAQRVQDYYVTNVFLRGKLFPAMRVRLHGKQPTDEFYVWTGFPFGVASERRVREYLSAVSGYL